MCAKELDMRDVLSNLPEYTGASLECLEYEAGIWLDHLAPLITHLKSPLMRCNDSTINQNRHRYHAQANINITRDRIRELEEKLSKQKPAIPERELDQKFQILFSANQAKKDFNQSLDAAREFEYQIALLFIDIDKFKNLNTEYGEAKIDKTIFSDFQKLLKRLTHQKASAYRYGGEEFLVLLTNYDYEEAKSFAEKLCVSYEKEEFKIDGKSQKLTVSIGGAFWPNDGNTYNEILDAANKAEHKAKEQGRNRVIFTDYELEINKIANTEEHRIVQKNEFTKSKED